MIDTSDAAIEADLSRAESSGTPGMIAMLIGRAQIRATLRAAQTAAPPAGRPSFQPLPAERGSADIQIAQGPFGDSYAVPAGASFEDRVEAAARLLQVDEVVLRNALDDAGVWPHEPSPEGTTNEIVPPAEPDFELDIEDGDGSHTEDDLDEVDEDFFADVKKARKR